MVDIQSRSLGVCMRTDLVGCQKSAWEELVANVELRDGDVDCCPEVVSLRLCLGSSILHRKACDEDAGASDCDFEDPRSERHPTAARSEASTAEECKRGTLCRCSAEDRDRPPSAGLCQLGYGLTEDRRSCGAD